MYSFPLAATFYDATAFNGASTDTSPFNVLAANIADAVDDTGDTEATSGSGAVIWKLASSGRPGLANRL